MNTLMTNDEYFGESMVGTRDEFRATLMGNFREWHADYEGEMSFDEYVENALDEHLTEADADEIENCERLNAPVPSKIKDSRKSAGLTQEQAARLIGATRRAWQEWEAGRRNMPGAKWELFLRKSKAATMLTLSGLIDQFGANGVIRIDAGNGSAGPMWCAWDDDLAGEIGCLEMSKVDPDDRAYDDDDNARTYKQEAVYVIGDYDSDEMYASRWIHGGNGYMYRFIF